MISPQVGRIKLEELGWVVEEKSGHLVAKMEHRRILLYRDGRVEFRDPTIRARYQMDAVWLRASQAVWPDVRL
jgi:hypothetical protein